jgi:hypothetical protein
MSIALRQQRIALRKSAMWVDLANVRISASPEQLGSNFGPHEYMALLRSAGFQFLESYKHRAPLERRKHLLKTISRVAYRAILIDCFSQ